MPPSLTRHPAAAPLFGPLSVRRYTANGVDFDMVRVPPGRFISAQPEDEAGPKRQILLSYPFEMGVFQASVKLWSKIVSDVQTVSEDQIKSMFTFASLDVFCERLSALGLGIFRLPTTAELVWAARCGVPALSGSSDRALLRLGSGVIRLQGDGEVGAAGLLDQHGGPSDISCERQINYQDEHESLSMVDPVFSLEHPTLYQRRAMGGRPIKRGRQLHPYLETHRNVAYDSLSIAFRLVRVPSSLKLEAY